MNIAGIKANNTYKQTFTGSTSPVSKPLDYSIGLYKEGKKLHLYKPDDFDKELKAFCSAAKNDGKSLNILDKKGKIIAALVGVGLAALGVVAGILIGKKKTGAEALKNNNQETNKTPDEIAKPVVTPQVPNTDSQENTESKNQENTAPVSEQTVEPTAKQDFSNFLITNSK